MVIASDDPLVCLSSAGKFGDYVVECLEAPVRFYAEMNFGRPGAEAISDRKASAPRSWSDRASKCSEQRLRIAIGNRKHRYLGDGCGLRDCEALRILRSSDSWRERVSRIDGHIRNRAALNPLRGAHGSIGENAPTGVSIVSRIGIDQAPDRAVLGRYLWVDTAPRAAVFGDDDRPFYRNAALLELLVVGGHSIVDEDKRTGDIAVD